MKLKAALIVTITMFSYSLQAQNVPVTRKGGAALFKQGKIKEAEDLFTKAIDQLPDSAWPYVGRATARVKLKDTSGAVDDYTKAISVDKNYPSAYSGIGMIEFYRNHYDSALKYLNKAIDLKPEEAPEAYAFRGIIKDHQGDTAAALVDFNKAIELKPNMSEAFCGRGALKFEKKDYKGALKDYTKASTVSADMIDAFVGKGKAMSKMKNFDGAADAFNAALNLNDNYAPAYDGEGFMKIEQKDYKAAVSCYNKAIKADPKNGLYYADRGMAELNVKNSDKEACADLNKAKDLGYSDPEMESALSSNCN